MPQDSLRSVVYRSFVTCDDAKGVVECKTIRKSKKVEDKTKNRSIQQDSNTSTSCEEERKDKVPKGSKEELQNMSSFQIMEVSRGAEKLNEVIDSWSNRTSFDKQSKYIAKDLLKGALDLQESLAMLGKLQEVSQDIVQSKKRHKEKLVEGRVNMSTEFTDSNPFGDYNQTMDFHKPRLSADGSSRDCYDELREVIRESFARQNLLPKVSSKEKDHIDRKNLESCMDFPSSSSSQSSLLQSHSSSCSSSKVQHEKPKGPNLIAKLMGLEEVSKDVNPIIYKQMEKEKLSNQRSHLIDVDLPRPRKPRFMVQKVVKESRTLEEIIETMQFKGLLGRKSFDGSGDGKYRSDVSYMRRSSAAEGPPIVLMRPRYVHDHRAEEFHENYWINEEKPIKSRQMPRKMREEFPLYELEVPRRQCKFTETNEKLRARRTPKQKLDKDKEGKTCGESHARVVKKTLDIQDRISRTAINHSKPSVPRMQKNEAIVKRIDNLHKVASNAKKQAEIKDAKSQESVKTQDVGKIATLTTTRGSNVSKCQIPRGKTAPPDKPMKSASLRSNSPKKNMQKGKPNSKPSAALVQNIENDDNLPVDHESDIQGSLVKSTAFEQTAEEVMDGSFTSISDNSGNAASSPSKTPVPTIEDDVKYIQDGSCIPCRNLDETKDCKSVSNTRYVLMSSASFLNRVEELFDTGPTCDPTLLRTASLPDIEILDAALLLECAKEILERKSLRCTRTTQPLSRNLFTRPQIHLSLDQLVEEICDGIEDLKSYSKSCGDIIVGDSIDSMLKKDVWRNGEVTGAWDLGLWSGFSIEEVNVVVNDVEKLILSEIVDDVVIEFI